MVRLLLSVVIPSHNQGKSLKETLPRLEKQTIQNEQFEVVLVDDGSTDDTREFAESFESTYLLRYLFQEKSGAAAARNLGAEEANSELILFLDADMICDSELFSSHLRAHQSTSRVIVEGSRKPWHTATSPKYYRVIDVDTTFLPNLHREKNFGDMLSCNLSVEKRFFQEVGGFDTGLSRWEDIDFAFRAVHMGAQLKFVPEAVAYHNHPMPFIEYCQKQLRTHQVAVELAKKHPGILDQLDYLKDRVDIDWSKDQIPLIIRKLIRKFFAWTPVLKSMEFIVLFLEKYYPADFLLSRLYAWIIASYQVLGLRNGGSH